LESSACNVNSCVFRPNNSNKKGQER
jgi:hypothetical protein